MFELGTIPKIPCLVQIGYLFIEIAPIVAPLAVSYTHLTLPTNSLV